ncbi:MAG: HlyD family efflux transporter periplasmic adaptor subunit [Hyphomicrobiales bacterium]|nr:HlyD family efflux transporter periplasmic adaptor subunit [Hyphomicrobiales bacterium]
MSGSVEHSNTLPDGAGAGVEGLTDADADGARLWAAFANAQQSDEFCAAWLSLQCGAVAGARAGLLLLQDNGGAFAPAAVWPDPMRDVTYLGAAAEQALSERRGVIRRSGAPDNSIHVAYPVDVRGRLWGVVVVDIATDRHRIDLQGVLRQLHWGIGWLESLFWQREAEGDTRKLIRTAAALNVLAVAQELPKLSGATMAVANELASRLDCDRVDIGLKKRHDVRVHTLSHSSWFLKKGKLLHAIENAMGEALDQHGTVVYPPPPEGERRITVAHADLARTWGGSAIATAIMTHESQAVGAITLERQRDEPFDHETVLLLETVAELVGPLLDLKAKQRRWISGRIADAVATGVKALIGPRRPTLKIIAVLVVAAAGYLATATADFRVSAKTVLEGAVQRAAVAPFDGFIAEAPVRAGDIVGQGALLARLDDKDLELDRLKWLSEKEKLVKRLRDAHAKHERANMHVLQTQIDQAEAQIALIEEKLSRTRIEAPFAGLVVSGDLSQMLGTPISQGKILFEVAPLAAYRAILQVDERDIQYVAVGQTGTLALAGLTGETLPLKVVKVTPVAMAQEGRNFFRVEAELDDSDVKLRPGMEGVAKVSIEERPLVWVWARRLIEWARLFIWKWTP